MALITTDDLKTYALWLSGEPTDGTSDYESIVLTHMQFIYDLFVTGGTFGTRDIATSAGLYSHIVDIAMTDWLWLRKYPPFAFNTTPATIGSTASAPLNQGVQIGTVDLVFGSDVATFSIAPYAVEAGVHVAVENFRLKPISQEQGVPTPPITVPRIADHTLGSFTATLDAAWPQESQTLSNFVIFRDVYDLPDDMQRFCEAWKVQGGFLVSSMPLNIGSNEQVFDNVPITDFNMGPPDAAARVNDTSIVMNRWDTFSYRIEGSYIFTPTPLVLEQTPTLQQPVIPTRFRSVLSIGAAMMMLQDKVDSRANAFASQFRELVHLMGIEFRKEQSSGSELNGRHLYRSGQGWRRRGLATTSGLPFI